MIPDYIKAGAIEQAMILYGMEIKETKSNRGFFIDMMIQKFGGKPGWAWCMYAVQFCYYMAYKRYGVLDFKSPLLKYNEDGSINMNAPNGHCYSVWQHAKQSEELDIITADQIASGITIPWGSIYIRYDDTHAGHTGIVVSHWQDDNNHDRDIIKTIEGNASDALDKRKYKLPEMIENNFKGVIV
jgi:hypothetical protein